MLFCAGIYQDALYREADCRLLVCIIDSMIKESGLKIFPFGKYSKPKTELF